MVSQKNIRDELNIKRQCRSYGLSMWQCPQFLFLVMGIVIIATSALYYFIGSYFGNNMVLVALGDLLITCVLLIISFVVTKNFEKLAEISRMKSEFVGVVTHQLRSPLTNLKWTIEFLTSKEFSGDATRQEEYYSNLRENVRRMVELTDTLLFVSKMEQGLVPFNKKEVSLVEVVNSLISEFKSFALASNVVIDFIYQKNIPLAYIDPSQIKIVIECLIDNAIKYTKNGGRIKIVLEKRDKDIYFEIKDSGVGIPEKDQNFIFQKFFRAENSKKDQVRGSGLGLYIAKSIIEQSKGKIGFTSEINKGTSFHFNLPIK